MEKTDFTLQYQLPYTAKTTYWDPLIKIKNMNKKYCPMKVSIWAQSLF